MALFNKKKITLDEIVAALEEMTPEDKAALKAMLDDTPAEEEAPAEETTEEVTETEETEDAPVVEEAPTEEIEESTNDGEETPTPDDVEAQTEAPVEAEEEAPVEEAVTEEVAETEENTDKGEISELYAMLADLKKTVEALAARINADDENEGNEDESEAFGITPNNFGGDTHQESDVEKMKAKYWSF
jgi:hypothetical protein